MGGPRRNRQAVPRGALGGVLGGLSRKSLRVLEAQGVIAALEAGSQLVVTGRVARLALDGPFVRMAFRVDEDRLGVGYAVGEGIDGPWTEDGGEFEPFTLRAHGYYTRFLKRLRPAEQRRNE